MKRLKRILSVAVVSIIVFSSILMSIPVNHASALAETDSVYQKAMATAIRQCYEDDELQNPLTIEIYDAYNSVFMGGNATLVPNINGNGTTAYCADLLGGYIEKLNVGSSLEDKTKFFESLGYTKDTSKSSRGKCFSFAYNITKHTKFQKLSADNVTGSIQNVKTKYVCADEIEGDVINVDKLTLRDADTSEGDYHTIAYEVGTKNKLTLDCATYNANPKTVISFEKGVTTWTDFKKQVYNSMLKDEYCVSFDHPNLGWQSELAFDGDHVAMYEISTGDTDAEFVINNWASAAAKGTKTMLGTSYSLDPQFDDTETFTLYQEYLKDFYKADIVCDNISEDRRTALTTSGYVEVAVFDGTAKKKGCLAKAKENANSQSVGISRDKTFGELMTFSQICEWMNGHINSVKTASVPADSGVTTRDGTASFTEPAEVTGADSTDPIEQKCYDNAKSFGWIICPAVFGLREFTDNMYEVIEPLIQVDSSIVSQMGSNDSSLFQAWNTFRSIANIIFVILFIFIIFSQLTGFGIDNYGIKKMLPKLIITAILVNLSFIICALAIDLSNVIGASIKQLLESLGSMTMRNGDVVTNAIDAQQHFVGEIVSWFVIAGTITGFAIALEGFAIVIPILLFLLVTAISIIFAMIVLGLRQAFVVMLIVLSPIAIAFSVLPNTEKIFKRWLEAIKGILIIYPVIGALLGAGYLTASILYSSDTGIIMTIVAGLLTVIPYFMIPSLTRKSIDGIGKIGERIGNLSNRAGRGARDRINNTNAVKNAKADSHAAMQQRYASRYMRSREARNVEDAIANGRKVNMRRANRYARNAGLATSMNQANINARAAQSQFERMRDGSTGYDAAMSAAELNEDAVSTKNYETMISAGKYTYGDGQVVNAQDNNQIAAALEHELTRGDDYDSNKVRALQNMLYSKGKDGRNLVKNTIDKAHGKMNANAVSDLASNAMNNHAGTLKDKDREQYEFFKKNATATNSNDVKTFSSGNYLSNGVSSLSAGDMVNMDTQALNRFVGTKDATDENGNVIKDENGNPKQVFSGGFASNLSNPDSQRIAAQLATDALNDEHLSQNLSSKQRTALENIITAYNNTGAAPLTPSSNVASSDSISIDHGAAGSSNSTAHASTLSVNHDAALGAYQDRLNRKVASNDMTRKEADILMAKAKAHFYDKDRGVGPKNNNTGTNKPGGNV